MTDAPKDAPRDDLGVYVHWPYCARICPYCDFNVVRDRGRTDEQVALADAIVADLVAQVDPANTFSVIANATCRRSSTGTTGTFMITSLATSEPTSITVR